MSIPQPRRPSPFNANARRALHEEIAAVDPGGPPVLRLLCGPAPASPPPPPSTLHPAPSVIALLPGSFDPFTRAHAALARAALAGPTTQAPDLLLLTLTQRTVDKEDTHVAGLEDRALLLHQWAQSQRPAATGHRIGVALCNRGLYVEQAQAARDFFPSPARLIFVIGYDKLVQILDARYYVRRDEALAELFSLASFWVAPRGAEDAQALANLLVLPQNREFASAIHFLAMPPAFARVSATDARAALRGGRLPRRLLPAATLRFIRDTGAYLA